jgi:hypothetical protein
VTHRCALLAFPLYVSRALVLCRNESVTRCAGLHVFPAAELPRLIRRKREKPSRPWRAEASGALPSTTL